MIKIKIKALSVNEAWQGRRFKTYKYKAYESKLLALLPKLDIIPKKMIKLEIWVGFARKNSDIDNILKPFIDILQKKYSFDDKLINEMHVFKDVVGKGNEYINFTITQ